MAFWKQQINNLFHSWGRFWQLTWQERWLLLQAFVLLPVTAVLLKLMNFQRVHSLLSHCSPMVVKNQGDDTLEQASVTARLVQAAASRIPFKLPSCLVRSTTLWYLLRRQGIGAEIRIGVNKEDGVFSAHAWVEIDGIVLNDKPDIHDQFDAFEQITSPDNTEKI